MHAFLDESGGTSPAGLAQVVRTGCYREVAVKGMGAQELRMLLVACAGLVTQRQAMANTIRGLLKSFGLTVTSGPKGLFEGRVRAAAEGNDALLAIVEPLLAAWRVLREQADLLDSRINARAKAEAADHRRTRLPALRAECCTPVLPADGPPL